MIELEADVEPGLGQRQSLIGVVAKLLRQLQLLVGVIQIEAGLPARPAQFYPPRPAPIPPPHGAQFRLPPPGGIESAGVEGTLKLMPPTS